MDHGVDPVERGEDRREVVEVAAAHLHARRQLPFCLRGVADQGPDAVPPVDELRDDGAAEEPGGSGDVDEQHPTSV